MSSRILSKVSRNAGYSLAVSRARRAEGRYLGEVSVPPNFSLEPLPFIGGTDVIARVEDEAGTIMVKRYRLVLPGEEER